MKVNNGTIEATKTHMGGLSRMVKFRGGFHNAQFPPAVQRQIAWFVQHVLHSSLADWLKG